MRKFIAVLLTLAMIFTLCACNNEEVEPVERDCGVYVTVQASDIYTVSCGTSSGSESFDNDGGPIEAGTVLHFDFSAEAAESAEPAEINYSICAYDKDVEIVADASFVDDFSNMARIDIIISEDHSILYAGQKEVSGGDVVIDIIFRDGLPEGVSVQSPLVILSGYPDAAEKINASIDALNSTFVTEQYNGYLASYNENTADNTEAEPFSMARTVRVPRGDSAVLSIRMVDRVNLGTQSLLSIYGHNFDVKTGQQLGLADVISDFDGFKSYCVETISVATANDESFLAEDIAFVEGYAAKLPDLISDGHWYLSRDGLVIIANPGDITASFHEFTFSYEDIVQYLKEEYAPVTMKGDSGDVFVCAPDGDDDCKLLGPDGLSQDSISYVIRAAGNVYDIQVYNAVYYSDYDYLIYGQYGYCSDLTNSVAYILPVSSISDVANILISYITPDGKENIRTVTADTSGNIIIKDPLNGSSVIPCSDSFDFNGDGKNEKIESFGGKLNIGDASVDTGFSTVSSVSAYDFNMDGICEIIVNGDGKTIIYSFDIALTPISDVLNGEISGVNCNQLFVSGTINFVSDFPVKCAYCCVPADNGLRIVPTAGSVYEFDTSADPHITPIVAVNLTDGTVVQKGTAIHLISTDGASYIYVSTDTGATGVLGISQDANGVWYSNNHPASDIFTVD